MADDTTEPIPAGAFADWVAGMQAALRGERDSDVPCGGCTACCRASQFVHIEPDETETIARIPRALLFPAPGLPAGHLVLGYDDRGHCPMLVDDACSIYQDRPRTCRTYDCRIYPAAGVDPGEVDARVEIGRRTSRWQFDHPTRADRARHDAVRAASTFLRERGTLAEEGSPPIDPTRRAVLAVRVHELFIGTDEQTGEASVVDPDPYAVRDALTELWQDDEAGVVGQPGGGWVGQ